MLACSDSRVPVERIFDRGIGDMFVVRVAGNVCGADEVASLEYGVDHLGTPLLVVLGHTKCGAVMAALSKGEAHGNIPALLDKIAPAIAAARKKNPGLADKDLMRAAIIANVWQSIADMYKSSAILREKTRDGKLTVVGAIYDISNGKIELGWARIRTRSNCWPQARPRTSVPMPRPASRQGPISSHPLIPTRAPSRRRKKAADEGTLPDIIRPAEAEYLFRRASSA